MRRSLIVAALALNALLLPALAASARAQPPAAPQRGVEQYVRIDQLPAAEKVPAAPFVIAAYAIVWLIAMLYIGTIWRRVSRLEGEFHALERRARKDSPS
jgi:CcmD family protein